MSAVNVEAYEFFLRSREQSLTCTRTGNIAARNWAGAAIAVDPRYEAAHALIAFTHVPDYINAWSTDPEHSLRTGLEPAQQAVGMDEEQPDGHFALGMACMWSRDLDRAGGGATWPCAFAQLNRPHVDGPYPDILG
jgi:adenylate cyclase